MKVGSLFAEIGFKIDSNGVEKFSNTLKSFHKQISSGLKDLRSYAKAAREISQAMRDAYVPTRTEAKARYAAETQRMLVQSKLAAIRAKKFEQDSNTRALNAASRAKQVELKEKGISGQRGSGSRMDMIIRSLAMLSRNTIFSSLGGVVGAMFSPMGSVIGVHIGKMIDKVIGAIFRATTWLGKTIISGMRFGMAYRDYRNFTGRSTSGLGGLMARTFNTTSMNPEDVLRDAARLESDYWGMILGQGNPALWQLLGVSPTGTGEVDLQNLIGRIGGVTGGFQNRGLARYLFKLAGLDEDYLNMMLDKSGGNIDVSSMIESSKEWEKVNKELRKFEWNLRKFKSDLAVAFGQSELFEKIKKALIELAGNLPEIIDKFKALATALGNIIDFLRETFPSLFGDSEEKIREDARKRMNERIAKDGGGTWAVLLNSILHPIDYQRSLTKAEKDQLSPYKYLPFGGLMAPISMSNNYYVNSPEEAGRATGAVMRETQNIASKSGQSLTQQQNASYFGVGKGV